MSSAPSADFLASVEVLDFVAVLRIEAAQFHRERFIRRFRTTEGLDDTFIQIRAVELPRDPAVASRLYGVSG